VSTILKALKRAESDSISGDHSAGEATSPQPRKRASSDRARPRWRGFHLFIPIFVLLAGVGIWRNLTSTDSPPEKQPVQTFPITKQPSTKEASKPTGAGTKPQPNADESQTSPPTAMDSREQPDRQESTDDSVSADIDMKPPVAAGNRARKPSLKSDTSASQASTEKSRHPENTKKESHATEKAGSIKPNSSNAERWRDAKSLESDQMMLQAVAWAPRPEKRMGVIDGQVVREGDDANGYTVVKIRKQNVILQRDGQYFRLEFQRR